MHSTHTVSCRNCGLQLAFWSGFGDNLQYNDEYECKGTVIVKRKNYWRVGTCDFVNYKPTVKEIKEKFDSYGFKNAKEVTSNSIQQIMEEENDCVIQNDTYYCEKCAKRLKYKCSVCGGKIKLTRKRQ